mmetsp:Transcript_35318/g.65427  ORF Transcript_35318/g.65427 Transcript_35318/m.65427 type:complete len:94 (-) Transcript_35318:295-576(-)
MIHHTTTHTHTPTQTHTNTHTQYTHARMGARAHAQDTHASKPTPAFSNRTYIFTYQRTEEILHQLVLPKRIVDLSDTILDFTRRIFNQFYECL